MIKIGNDKIGSVAIGDTSIAKIYKGTELLYQKKSNLIKFISSEQSIILWLGQGGYQTSINVTPNKLTNFKVNNNYMISGIFYGNPGLKYVDFSYFDFTNQTNLDTLFYECTNLESINLGNFNFFNISSFCYMFHNCNSLNHIKCSQDIKDWIIGYQDIMQLPTAMRAGGNGTWEII